MAHDVGTGMAFDIPNDWNYNDPGPPQQAPDDWFASNGPSGGVAPDLEGQVRAAAAAKGIDYDPSDLADVQRHGGDLNVAINKYAQRASSNGGPSGGGRPSTPGGIGLDAMGLGRGSAYGYTPFNEQFRAPTADEVRNTPGYQAAFDQGQQAIERSAAARGTLLTGGTAKGLTRYGQDYADQQYGSAYDRSLGEYLNKFNINQANQSNAFNVGRAGRMDDFSIQSFYDQFGEQQKMNQFNMGRTNRMDDFNIYNTLDTNYYNRLFGIADYGQNANNQLMGANNNLMNTGVDMITGAGNSRAAGQVGAGNAWNAALSGIGNDFMLNQLMRNQRSAPRQSYTNLDPSSMWNAG